MKSCEHNREHIALLALDALDARSCEELRAHLEACSHCRSYWEQLQRLCRDHAQAARALPDIEPSADFHRRLVRQIQPQQQPTASGLEIFLRRLLPWRTAITAGTAMLLVGLGFYAFRQPKKTSTDLGTDHGTAVVREEARQLPTFSAYRMAINTSFEAFDAMLVQQAARQTSSDKMLTIAAAVRNELTE